MKVCESSGKILEKSSKMLENGENTLETIQKLSQRALDEADLMRMYYLSDGTKSLPIHCIIEQTNGSPSFDNSSGEKSMHCQVELDSYAILPGTTLLEDCVRAALLKLGYNRTEATGAKGAIQFKNWKPLDFEAITDNKSATIEDMLGDIIQVATLRIRICREPVLDTIIHEPVEWTDKLVRRAILDLLKDMSQSALAELSPLPQSMISNIVNMKYHSSLSSKKLREFGAWYQDYKISKQFTNQDIKLGQSRVTFHPAIEIPKLKAWYDVNPFPNDAMLQSYADHLNNGQVRMERPKVSVTHLRNWWKNTRQKHKKMQTTDEENLSSFAGRGGGGSGY